MLMDSRAIDAKIREARRQRFAQSSQMSLGTLIAQLRAIDARDDCEVRLVFGDFIPAGCHSWRGSFSELAIGYTAEPPAPLLLSDFIAQLQACVGSTFPGWKGGEFMMTEDTPVWVAQRGYSGSAGVVGAVQECDFEGRAYIVYIRTDYCDY